MEDPPTPCVFLPGVLECISRFLPRNEVACSLRVLNKATAAQFGNLTELKLSEPSPHDAFCKRWCEPDAMRPLTLERRVDFICLTAASGSLDNLEAAIAVAGLLPFDRAALAAAAAGHLHVCQWLQQHGWPLGIALQGAASGGHQNVCEWLLANGCKRNCYAPDAAARNGRVRLADWLLEKLDEKPKVSLVEAAAEGCDFATMRRLYLCWRPAPVDAQGGQALSELDAGRLRLSAAGSRTPDWQAKVEWLELQGHPRTDTVFRDAARCPDASDRLVWLQGRGYPVHVGGVALAADAGSTEALQLLLDDAAARNLGLISSYACRRAAIRGHLPVLQLLHSRGWNVHPGESIFAAAWKGHLPVVSWLWETFGVGGVDLGYLLVKAAGSGNMELLVWLRERGCPFVGSFYMAAAGSGCAAALEWAAENGCPMPDVAMLDADDPPTSPYTVAAWKGDIATLACLRRLGCPWGPNGEVFTECVSDWDNFGYSEHILPCLRWLVEAGCPVDWRRVKSYLSFLPPGVADWVRQRFAPEGEKEKARGKKRRHGA